MIERYRSEKMNYLWSDQNRYNAFLKIEMAVNQAWYKLKKYDYDTFIKLSKADYKLEDIYIYEQETKHDIIAFTKAIGKNLLEEKKWLHYGLTSTDVVDSGMAVILKSCNEELKIKIDTLLKILKRKSLEFKKTPTIGRTHGIHAEVTSFGLKFLLWYSDLKRIKEVFLRAAENVEVIKISGAVGNYSANDPQLEKLVSEIINIKSADISTQVLQRDRHANYLSSLALLASQLEKMSTEIRHLSRTEVGEVSEYFSSNQKGSSAMPHKKNPISSENISGLSRVVRGYMITAYENINLWHERDISHSSAERIILADSTTLVDYMLNKMIKILDTLVINKKNITKNIENTKGVIFSQHLLSSLINKGLLREEAYNLIQKMANISISESISFEDLILENDEISRLLSYNEVKDIFDINKLLKNVEFIYEKVLA